MNRKQANKLAIKIYESMTSRLNELSERNWKHNTTDAYYIAFQIGLLADIESVLLKVRKLK